MDRIEKVVDRLGKVERVVLAMPALARLRPTPRCRQPLRTTLVATTEEVRASKSGAERAEQLDSHGVETILYFILCAHQ